MAQIRITGASDDLIEIEGDIREEFNVYLEDDEERFLAISDGTLFRVVYDKDGIWRFTQIAKGSSKITKVDGEGKEPDLQNRRQGRGRPAKRRSRQVNRAPLRLV